MAREETSSKFSSIQVVEPLPPLIVTLRRPGGETQGIFVEGLSGEAASKIPWGEILDFVVGKLGPLVKGGSGGGGDGGCTIIKITNKDGSTTEIKQCDPPKQT
jgi:hypothetical protein